MDFLAMSLAHEPSRYTSSVMEDTFLREVAIYYAQ